jgi:hypothetical protein
MFKQRENTDIHEILQLLNYLLKLRQGYFNVTLRLFLIILNYCLK